MRQLLAVVLNAFAEQLSLKIEGPEGRDLVELDLGLEVVGIDEVAVEGGGASQQGPAPEEFVDHIH